MKSPIPLYVPRRRLIVDGALTLAVILPLAVVGCIWTAGKLWSAACERGRS
jgi:hypothetical protein